MKKPNGYDEARAYGDYIPLPAGNYVCKIMSVEETQSRAGKPMIIISLDIAEGEYKDFFAKAWRADTRQDKKWGCRVWQLVNDYQDSSKTSQGFKTFITSVEKSNKGFAVKWDDDFEPCFKGKLVGAQFRREEYIDNLSNSHWSTKPASFRSADTIREGKLDILPDKPLTEEQAKTVFDRDPKPASAPLSNDLSDFEEVISDGELPF